MNITADDNRHKLLLLVNQHSRSGAEHLDSLVRFFKSRRCDVLVPDTNCADDVSAAIIEHAQHIDLVVVAGGDGSMHAAAKGLLQSGLPLAVLPLGTANDLANTLGIPEEPLDAAAMILESWDARNIHKIDLGVLNFDDELSHEKGVANADSSQELFFNVAHMGLSAQITRKLDSNLKRRWGVFSYLIAAFRAVSARKSFKVRLGIRQMSDQGVLCVQQHTMQSMHLSLGNGRQYGGGMLIRNDASIDDQRLTVYSVRPRKFWQLLWMIPWVKTGKHRFLNNVDEFNCQFGQTAADNNSSNNSSEEKHEQKDKQEDGQKDGQAKPNSEVVNKAYVHIATSRPMRVTADGEDVGYTPLYCRLLPQAIRVLVPLNYTQIRKQQKTV